jgi:general secretion pathway protein B
MSYILDALKKSEQERHQGSSPHILSIHGQHSSFKSSGPNKRRQTFWIVAIGLLLLSLCIGILFAWYQSHLGTDAPGTVANDPPKVPEQQTSSNLTESDLASPVVIVRDQTKMLVDGPVVDMVADNPMDVEEQEFFESLPFLKDLPYALQKGIPELKFAGHTYSTNPSQRMIIINNTILREGDKIDSNTHLKEITWEGVIIDYKNNTFRVNTN